MNSHPQRGAIWWVDFDPREGHEQSGIRPALIISNSEYNRRIGLMLCLPITNKAKGYSTELPLPAGLETTGVVLTSHVYTIDWQARAVQFKEIAPSEVVEQAVDKLLVLLS